MADARFDVYYRRAIQLADAMRLCQDDMAAYASAAALLAVHSAISYSDALLIMLTSRRSHGENHRDAVRTLKMACTSAKIDQQGVAHFQKLLNAKTNISYGDQQVDDERAKALCITAGRFQAWVEKRIAERGKE